MDIKKFTVLRAVTTSKHARDQYELRCYMVLNLSLFEKSNKIFSPLIFERILYSLFLTNKYNILFLKKEINSKF